MTSSYLLPNEDFCAGSIEHIAAVFILVLLGLVLTFWAKRSPHQSVAITRGFAWALTANVLIWQIVKAYVGQLPADHAAYVPYHWGEDLPLNPCNWLAFVALAYSYKPQPWMWHMLYFFVWVFTFNAVLTPALYENFPHFTFCKFWVAHTGLVMFVIHLNRLKAPQIRFKNLIHSYAYLQIFTLVCLITNAAVGPEANYFFLAHKPFSASILDILGPWPYYIVQGDIIAFGLFVLAWLPYRFISNRTSFAS